MSSNNRIFYACQAVGITNHGDEVLVAGDMVHGLQSVGITTNFNLEQAFEMGQIEIYENIEGTPDVEVTLEKVLDGYPLIYHMASTGVKDTSASGLAARSEARSDVRLGIFPDINNNLDNAGAGEESESEVYCSGMYISSVSYTIPVDGSATESVTLVGNNKLWLQGSDTKITAGAVDAFDGDNEPKALTDASGGISQREDVMLSGCILPNSIKGVNGAGYANGLNLSSNTPRVHIQNISISTDFSREDILELGRKTPYHRPATFPIEVSCEIEAITTSGDFVNAYEFGDSNLYLTTASGNNTSNEDIYIFLRAGYGFDLGPSNRLASVSYGGGDAGGGNATCTYSYTNFNELDVQRKGDYLQFGQLRGSQPFGTVPSDLTDGS